MRNERVRKMREVVAEAYGFSFDTKKFIDSLDVTLVQRWGIVAGLRNEETERRRATYSAIIAARMPDGTMRVEEGGRDCDGVRYSGHIHRIPATLTAFLELEQHCYDSADGPFWLHPVPRDEPTPSAHHRDLVMEAFEDGHSHVIFD